VNNNRTSQHLPSFWEKRSLRS